MSLRDLSMPLSGVFFDLDGTLLDTARDLCAALDRTMEDHGVSPLPFEDTRPHVSNGSYALIEKGFGIPREHPDTETLRDKLLAHYQDNLCELTRPFDGIETLIQELAERDIPWGIITNKPAAYAEPLMKRIQFASEPACLICPDHVENRKPHPESMYLACNHAGSEEHSAFYIGDHQRDIECGQRAGAKTIAVNYGYIPKNINIRDWGADYCVDYAHEIWPILCNY